MTAERCACTTHKDGSVTKFMCPLHADMDPCEAFSRITGHRRQGTIRKGKCTNCGWPLSNRVGWMLEVDGDILGE